MTTNVLALNAVGLLLSSLMIDLVFAVDLSKPETRSTSPAEKSIFVAPDASCAVWTDGCRNCTKDLRHDQSGRIGSEGGHPHNSDRVHMGFGFGRQRLRRQLRASRREYHR